MSGTMLRALVLAAATMSAGCTAGPESARDAGAGPIDPAESPVVPIPPVALGRADQAPEPDDRAPSQDAAATRPPVRHGDPIAAIIDADRQLAIVEDGRIREDWTEFTAFPSPDRTAAVLTLGPDVAGTGAALPIVWVSLPDGEQVGEQTMSSASELTATSLDGTFAAFTSPAGELGPDAIAGSRSISEIEIVSRDAGSVFRRELTGNFVPEAFGSRLTDAGIPALVFLLEYVPAAEPRFYRVRVLSTETGEVSLPVNLRDKTQQVDERMAGFTRSQVVAEEHGLLFTLYRGTIDGTPDGEPYAFVHTLDFADGVWCLDVDPTLELDRVPGSLAVGGDRLYVGSANGRLGSFPIPSIVDPASSPTMDWTVEITRPADDAPALLADDHGVWVGPDDPVSRLIRIDTLGERGDPLGLPSSGASTLAFDATGEVQAIADGWSTIDLGPRPSWLDEVEVLVVD